MKNIKLVKQMDEHGCTIACLSMVTGVSYFQMRATMYEEVSRLRIRNDPLPYRQIGLTLTEMQDILVGAFRMKVRFIKFIDLKLLKKHCIIIVCGIDMDPTICGHAIVYDAKDKILVDPLNEITHLEEHNIISCMEIQ